MEQMEEHISMQELHRLYLTVQRNTYNDKMFMAAMQGVKLPEYEDPDYADVVSFEEVKARAEAKRQQATGGKSSRYKEYEEMGFSVEEY